MWRNLLNRINKTHIFWQNCHKHECSQTSFNRLHYNKKFSIKNLFKSQIIIRKYLIINCWFNNKGLFDTNAVIQ